MLDNRMVGRTISQLRLANNYTQQDLADRMNVSHQAVSKWETGMALPDIQTMLELSKLFGVSIEQILLGEIPALESVQEDPKAPEETGEQPTHDQHGGMGLKRFVGLAPFFGKRGSGDARSEVRPQIREDSPRKSFKNRIAKKAIEEGNWQWIQENIEYIDDTALIAEIVERAEEWLPEWCFIDELLEKLDQESAFKLALYLYKAERWGEMDEVFYYLKKDHQAELLRKFVEDKHLEFVEEYADELPRAIIEEILEKAVEDSDWETIRVLEELMD